MATKNRFILTLSMKEKCDLEALAQDWGCSQADILKAGLQRLIEREKVFK